MAKKINAKETKTEKTVNMIYAGKTWEDVEMALGVTRAHLQRLLRTEFFKNRETYLKFLAKAKENKRKKAKNTIVVAETGALFVGFKIPTGAKVVVPEFCKEEIKKYAYRNGKNANKMINDPKITWMPSVHDGKLIKAVEPGLFKHRSENIVRLACKYLKEGHTVMCVTSSREIFELAGLQMVNPPRFQIVKI